MYGSAVLVTAPATLIDSKLGNRTAGHVRLTAAEGTLWTGRGSVEIRNDTGAALLTRELRWRLEPHQLLFGRVAWQLGFADDAAPGAVSASWSRIEVSQLDLALPAAAVAQALPAMHGYGFGGQVQVHVDTMAFGQEGTAGNATVQWLGASSDLAPVSPLGSYELRLQSLEAAMAISLRTLHGPLQGPLQLEGAGTLAGASYKFTGVARVSTGEHAVLAPFLRLFAVENPDGSFALQFN